MKRGQDLKKTYSFQCLQPLTANCVQLLMQLSLITCFKIISGLISLVFTVSGVWTLTS